MKLDTLKVALSAFPAGAVVNFDFGSYVGGLDSWRGDYYEATLTHADVDRAWTVGKLLEEVQEALDGKCYQGYKGGDFYFNESTTVYADDYGRYEERQVIGVVLDGNRVVITTYIND